MPRGNGSLIGVDATPTASAASGIWTVREAERYLRADKWPSTPNVPGAPTGVAGDGQVSLEWTAPTGDAPVTDYVVQFSDDAGATWQTFADGVSTATNAVVTGLTNDTGYVFRVIAVNSLGQGPVGSASGTITPTGPGVSLLLHFDTDFSDSSPHNVSLSASGGATISTAQSKFGGASLYLTAGSYLEGSGTESVFRFGTDPATIEYWIYPTANTFGVVAGPSLASGTDGLLVGVIPSGEGIGSLATYLSAGFASGGSVPLNAWTHMAFVLTGSGEIKRYINGQLVDTLTDIGTHGAYGVRIGHPSLSVDGYIDELRVYKGVAVYSGASFTVPDAPFADP